MWEQAPTFEQSGIRFPEDIPVVIPCLQKALTILAQQDEDPDVFQSLIYFFSTLLSSPPFHHTSDDHNIMDAWRSLRINLDNPYELCYGSVSACRQVNAVIERLDSITTFQQVRQSAQAHLRGSAAFRSYALGEQCVTINRGHDCIMRCAFELDIPDRWKAWLQLMYEKQPYKILDLPSASIDNYKNSFIGTLQIAAKMGGFAAMTSVIKFWLRQALTVVQVWDVRLRLEGNGGRLMPSYEWCVAAYQKMWYRFQNEVRNPLSEYPYMVRQELFRDIHFMRVIEECWKWVALATEGISARDFDPYETRMAIYKFVLTLVLNEFQSHSSSIREEIEKAFRENTEDSGYLLLAESPVVHVDNLHNDLRPRRILYDGLCREFYPHLLNMTEAEFEAMFSDSEDEEYEEYEDQSDDSELTSLEDVEVEAFGQRIDINQFTRTKEPDEGDFCTICQEVIGLGEPGKQRCWVPVTCSDTFHAECLDAWVNSAAKICNHCPHCKTQMTKLQRLTRVVDDTDEEMTV